MLQALIARHGVQTVMLEHSLLRLVQQGLVSALHVTQVSFHPLAQIIALSAQRGRTQQFWGLLLLLSVRVAAQGLFQTKQRRLPAKLVWQGHSPPRLPANVLTAQLVPTLQQ